MESDQAQSSEQAFNSLFNTPSSSIHSAAAVSLNPSTATPQKRSNLPDGQGCNDFCCFLFPMRFLQKQSWPWPRHSARPQGPTAAAPPRRSSRRRTQARWPRGVRAAWWERPAAARHLLCHVIGWTPVLRLSVGDRTPMIHIFCPVSHGHLMAYIHCLYVNTGKPHILIWFERVAFWTMWIEMSHTNIYQRRKITCTIISVKMMK